MKVREPSGRLLNICFCWECGSDDTRNREGRDREEKVASQAAQRLRSRGGLDEIDPWKRSAGLANHPENHQCHLTSKATMCRSRSPLRRRYYVRVLEARGWFAAVRTPTVTGVTMIVPPLFMEIRYCHTKRIWLLDFAKSFFGRRQT